MGNVTFSIHVFVSFSLLLNLTACTENSAPPQIESYAYSSTPAAARCESGARIGRAGANDGEASAEGLRYHVRTPSNYDATIAHPLLMVYAAAGQSGLASERMTGLTPAATASGFVIVYADHRPRGIPAVEQLGNIPGSVAKKWCIDEKRVFVTGHSDGGTASLALAVLDKSEEGAGCDCAVRCRMDGQGLGGLSLSGAYPGHGDARGERQSLSRLGCANISLVGCLQRMRRGEVEED